MLIKSSRKKAIILRRLGVTLTVAAEHFSVKYKANVPNYFTYVIITMSTF